MSEDNHCHPNPPDPRGGVVGLEARPASGKAIYCAGCRSPRPLGVLDSGGFTWQAEGRSIRAEGGRVRIACEGCGTERVVDLDTDRPTPAKVDIYIAPEVHARSRWSWWDFAGRVAERLRQRGQAREAGRAYAAIYSAPNNPAARAEVLRRADVFIGSHGDQTRPLL